MRILRNTVIVLLLIAFVVVAVIGLMVEAPTVLGFTPDRINAVGRSVIAIMRPGHGLFLFWIAVVLAALLTVVITIGRPRKPMKIEVQMGGGRVVIMDSAIKKYIRSALSELSEVTVRKIELKETRGAVSTDLYADVRTRENLPILERRIINRVRMALTEDLGITNLADVQVFIRDFEVTGRAIGHDTGTPVPASSSVEPFKATVAAGGAESVVTDNTPDSARASSFSEVKDHNAPVVHVDEEFSVIHETERVEPLTIRDSRLAHDSETDVADLVPAAPGLQDDSQTSEYSYRSAAISDRPESVDDMAAVKISDPEPASATGEDHHFSSLTEPIVTDEASSKPFNLDPPRP